MKDENKSKAQLIAELQAMRQRLSSLEKTQTELASRLERITRLTEEISDVVWMADLNLNITYVSPALQKMTGDTVEEHKRKSLAEKHPPASVRTLLQVFEEELRREHDPRSDPHRSRIIEVEQYKADGSLIWVAENVSFTRDASGAVTGILGVSRDITERKRMVDSLRESESLYRQAIEAAGAVPYRQSYEKLTDFSSRVVYDFIGDGIRQLTGYGPDEFNDFVWDSILQESVLIEELAEYSWKDAIHRVRTGQLPVWKCEHRVVSRDGSTHWILEAAVELLDEQGISHGSIGLYQDITARKQAEEKILQLNADLEQRVADRTAQLEAANKDLEAFSYSVSHDLRAPLRAIDGYSYILQNDLTEALSDEERILLDRVRSNVRRMDTLINDLLKFSRSGFQPLVMQSVNCLDLVQAVINTLQAGEENRPAEILIRELPDCQADPSLLMQVWVNLLSNAFKYTRRCAEVRIEVGSHISDKGEVVYYVKDNGVGFDMQYVDRLFTVFQRLHADPEFEGSGVGLALVRRIITRHGGRIWAEGEPDKGAAFYFTLGG